MFVRLGLFEFYISILLVCMSLYIIRGFREGLYYIVGKIVSVEQRTLMDRLNKVDFTKRSILYRVFVTLADPIITWVSFILLMIIYLVYIHVTNNILIQTLLLLLVIILGFIFPFRLFVRIYSWVKNMGVKKHMRWWILYWLFGVIYSLIIYYMLFFLMLFLNGPIILRVFGMMDVYMQTFMMQIYVQHVQAFLPMIGLSLIVYVVDVVVYFRNKNLQIEDNNGLY